MLRLRYVWLFDILYAVLWMLEWSLQIRDSVDLVH